MQGEPVDVAEGVVLVGGLGLPDDQIRECHASALEWSGTEWLSHQPPITRKKPESKLPIFLD